SSIIGGSVKAAPPGSRAPVRRWYWNRPRAPARPRAGGFAVATALARPPHARVRMRRPRPPARFSGRGGSPHRRYGALAPSPRAPCRRRVRLQGSADPVRSRSRRSQSGRERTQARHPATAVPGRRPWGLASPRRSPTPCIACDGVAPAPVHPVLINRIACPSGAILGHGRVVMPSPTSSPAGQTIAMPDVGRIAFVQSCWHRDIVDVGRDAFVAAMAERGHPADAIDCVEVPGAFEIPLRAKLLAATGRYAAIVAGGLVVDGGIYRHDFVARTVIDALMRVQLDTCVPV